MNAKTRKEVIKSNTQVGTEMLSNGKGTLRVTQVSDFNCYLGGVRHSWTSVESCFRSGALSFKDENLQALIK